MAVLIEGISVVVRRPLIARLYPGGWAGFVRDAPNRTLCADCEVARVGFMAPPDVGGFVADLARHGFEFQARGAAVDLVVVDQMAGPTTPCAWLDFGQARLLSGGKVSAARLRGDADSTVVVPEGWHYERSISAKFGFVPTGAKNESLTLLRQDDGIDVYLDRITGEEVFVGRTRR